MDNRQALEQALEALHKQIDNANGILSTYQKRLDELSVAGKESTREYNELSQKQTKLSLLIVKYEKYYDERKKVLSSPKIPIMKRSRKR